MRDQGKIRSQFAPRAASAPCRFSPNPPTRILSASRGTLHFVQRASLERQDGCVSEPTFDYIIIGAGTAGALVANRLSADRDRRVLLIEAGPRDNYHWIHIPVGYLYCIGNPRTDWLYNTEPDAGLNGRSLRYPRGKTLGGCSSIDRKSTRLNSSHVKISYAVF